MNKRMRVVVIVFVALALLNNSPDFDILFHAFAVCAVTAGINFVANETEMHFLGLTAAALVWLGVIGQSAGTIAGPPSLTGAPPRLTSTKPLREETPEVPSGTVMRCFFSLSFSGP